jgi:hypothetical protein
MSTFVATRGTSDDSSSDQYPLSLPKTVFASISSTRFCNDIRICIRALSIDGSMNKVLALKVCLVA